MFYLKNKEGNCFKEVESVSQMKALKSVGFEEYQPKAAVPVDDEPKAKAATKKNAVKSK